MGLCNRLNGNCQFIQTVAARFCIAISGTKCRGQLQVDFDDILMTAVIAIAPGPTVIAKVSLDVSQRLWTLERAGHVWQQPLTRDPRILTSVPAAGSLDFTDRKYRWSPIGSDAGVNAVKVIVGLTRISGGWLHR